MVGHAMPANRARGTKPGGQPHARGLPQSGLHSRPRSESAGVRVEGRRQSMSRTGDVHMVLMRLDSPGTLGVSKGASLIQEPSGSYETTHQASRR